METGIVLLSAFLAGGMAVRSLMLRAHRHYARPHELDEHYRAVKASSLRYLRVHGTLHLAAVEHLTDGPSRTALRYLEQMERDGLIRAQGNRTTKGVFYTRA